MFDVYHFTYTSKLMCKLLVVVIYKKIYTLTYVLTAKQQLRLQWAMQMVRLRQPPQLSIHVRRMAAVCPQASDDIKVLKRRASSGRQGILQVCLRCSCHTLHELWRNIAPSKVLEQASGQRTDKRVASSRRGSSCSRTVSLRAPDARQRLAIHVVRTPGAAYSSQDTSKLVYDALRDVKRRDVKHM